MLTRAGCSAFQRILVSIFGRLSRSSPVGFCSDDSVSVSVYRTSDGAVVTRTCVCVNVTLASQNSEHLRRFEKAVESHSEIKQCFLMSGGSDYLLHVAAATLTEFEIIHKTILSRLPGVARLHSSFIIRKVIERV